jgi:hypothetical protein
MFRLVREHHIKTPSPSLTMKIPASQGVTLEDTSRAARGSELLLASCVLAGLVISSERTIMRYLNAGTQVYPAE